MIEKLSIRWILLIGFIAHLPMLRNGFTYYSDDNYVLNNVLVHHINGDTVKALFSTYFDGHYHPLTLLSLAFTYLLSGTNAWGYQLTNLVFHLLSCWFVFKILTQLELKKGIVLLSTLIFAIHPLNVESVGRITERKDTQYVLFLLIAVYYFFEFCKDPAKRKFYLISILCFFLSLFSKGQAVVFPLILYVISWYKLKTTGTKIKHAFILPLFILSGIFAVLNYRAQIVTGYISDSEAISLQQAITYPSYIITHYIIKLFFPFYLSAQYPKPEINSFLFIYSAIILALLFGGYKLYKSKNYVAVLGLFLYVVSVFPMLRIIPVSENFMPDRYNYLGILGFGLFISGMFFRLAEKYKNQNLNYVLTGWIILLSLACFGRTTIWKNGLSVWEDAYKKYPEDEYATINYASNLTSSKTDISQGLSLYQKGIAISPHHVINKIYYSGVLTSLGRKEESLELMKEIMRDSATSPDDMSNKASILLQYGKPAESSIEFNKAVRLKPEFAKNRIKRAGYYMNQFLFDAAISELDTLEELHSNYLDLLYMMRTETYIGKGNAALAQKSLNEAKKIGADEKHTKELQNTIDNLSLSEMQQVGQMNEDQKLEFVKSLYSSGLYYKAYTILSEVLEADPKNEKAITYSISCAFKLNRPDLMKQYILELKKNNYAVNPNTLAYLAGLGIDV